MAWAEVEEECAVVLRAEVEEEHLTEAMAMMLRLQCEKAELKMELRQFRHFANEKMTLNAAEVDHLRTKVQVENLAVTLAGEEELV